MVEARRSPWWYRARAVVIAAIYVLALWPQTLYGADTPDAYEVLGRAFGRTGVLVALGAGVAAVVLCWLVRVWGSAYLRPATVWNADALTDRLIVDGPFRYVRNPLYLGNVFLAVGFAFLAPIPGAIFLIVANVAFVYALIAEESALMRARYGATFDRFVAAVPSLVPRLTPADVPGTTRVTPSLSAGLRSELFTGALAIGMMVLAIGGARALPVFYAIIVVGYVARVVASRNYGNSSSPNVPSS